MQPNPTDLSRTISRYYVSCKIDVDIEIIYYYVLKCFVD